MPNRTVYIRNSDLGLWEKLENKSEQIHNLLHSGTHLERREGFMAVGTSKDTQNSLKARQGASMKQSGPIAAKVGDDIVIDIACGHGYHPSLCKFAKNGKPCKK